MKPILCIVGASGSGKTLLIEKLIPLLLDEGIKVGVIKHTHHNFEIDQEGKDTWRFTQAGAQKVIISSRNKVGYIATLSEEMSIEEIVNIFFADMDLIIAEGYKQSFYPKIYIHHPEESEINIAESTIAIISDNLNLKNYLIFRWNEVEKLVPLIKEKLLNMGMTRDELILMVNGKRISLRNFAASILKNTIIGAVSTLKGCSEINEIIIQIKKSL